MRLALRSCSECNRLWRDHARISALRLDLMRSQASNGESQPAFTPRLSLGERIQMAASVQERLVRRIAEHERKAHHHWD